MFPLLEAWKCKCGHPLWQHEKAESHKPTICKKWVMGLKKGHKEKEPMPCPCPSYQPNNPKKIFSRMYAKKTLV